MQSKHFVGNNIFLFKNPEALSKQMFGLINYSNIIMNVNRSSSAVSKPDIKNLILH